MPFWKRRPKELGPPEHGPDFSQIDSREKAQKLVEEGVLEPLYLMPLSFGGVESPVNVVYVPIGFAQVKDGIDQNVIAPLVKDGSVSHYTANPEYRGSSFVPMAIQIEAKDPGSFTMCLAIWGEALEREDAVTNQDTN
ncbi:MAG: hypothetical protein KDA93_27060 [Planctomycetaceae bacterium]|nr:hypothetical protein [Planctomycetaceae bacterium]